MNSKILLLLAVMMITAATASAQWRGSREDRRRDSAPADSSLSEEYRLIVDNNIFIRERGRRSSPSTQPTSRPSGITPRSPEQTLMLTGIVIEEGELRAYFENLSTGTVQRVAPGEPIGRGHVIEIMIDAVAYAGGNGVQWVEIGHDLTGTPAVTMTTPSFAPSSGSPAAAGGAPATGGGAAAAPSGGAPAEGGAMSLEERMRQRARQLRGGN